jgi:hypothetical protein
MLLVLLFLAVTSAASAELCSVSTVFSYDVYVTYACFSLLPAGKRLIFPLLLSSPLLATSSVLLPLYSYINPQATEKQVLWVDQ